MTEVGIFYLRAAQIYVLSRGGVSVILTKFGSLCDLLFI